MYQSHEVSVLTYDLNFPCPPSLSSEYSKMKKENFRIFKQHKQLPLSGPVFIRESII